MRIFIDECLSPQLATRLNATGRHDAIHPLHVGRRGAPDHRVLKRCIAEDRVIVTENGRDFRRLAGRADIHPGLIIVPALDREATWAILQRAIAFLESRGDPMALMVNHVLDLDHRGEWTLTPLP
jgi:predicted nuclease of predicted toxin-antitoxin system